MIKKLNANGKEVKMQDDDEIQTGDKILLCLSRGPKRIKINGKYLTKILIQAKTMNQQKRH